MVLLLPPPATASALGPATWGGLRTITDHANAIWLGDLNYRLHATPDDDARRLIRSNQLTQLLEADQLRREMAAGRVFKVCVGLGRCDRQAAVDSCGPDPPTH